MSDNRSSVAGDGDGATATATREEERDEFDHLADALRSACQGDFAARMRGAETPRMREIEEHLNDLLERNERLVRELVNVGRVVGREGRMVERVPMGDHTGGWAEAVRSVNGLIDDLARPTTEIGRVITAVAEGDLSKKMELRIEGQSLRGEFLRIGTAVNGMVEQLSSFADEVTRVAREVGTEGKLGGQATVKGVSGIWKDLTDNVNSMAGNLTDQVRNIATVTTAVAQGDLSQKITVDAKGEILELKNTVNAMVDQLSSFADEVTRVAREVGTEGQLGGQATVKGVSGIWEDLTDNVNSMAGNLTDQVRNIATVTTAVAQGDLSQKITVDAKGEILELKNTVNAMVDQLSSFADEVTRVAREVGTEGQLGGQATVKGVSGIWEDLTDNVNSMAGNLTDQVRNIATVTTAVAQGDLSQKITVDAKGEILELKNTVNAMVDQLSSFADEVTRVAREVGTEGQLGGQATVKGVSGTWKDLTDNVNQLAANLTTQVRAIAEVATAVTRGDLTRAISVEAQGEVARLKDNINQMIANLRETTQKNAEQDWLKTNMARIGTLMQGQRDLQTLAELIMSELCPVVSAQHGAFFLAAEDEEEHELRMVASYGYKERRGLANRFKPGEGLIGQAALERKPILITDAPEDYVRVTSGLGDAPPVNIIVLPITFEGEALGVIELASLRPFTDVNQQFLDELVETIGVVVNTIQANMRTEELLEQSQMLTGELQSRSQELQSQQEELRETNDELQEKAALLAEQKRNVEQKNREIELARVALQEKAQQLALSSKYKSEFLANMSHELRTPLNSMLILAKLIASNDDGNLSGKQVEFAQTIHSSGSDLLDLINDILDLSKIEAGRMEVQAGPLPLTEIQRFVEANIRPLARDKGLDLRVSIEPDLPETVLTDGRRVQQILKNLLSNAVKFTDHGSVKLSIARPDPGRGLPLRATDGGRLVAFTVDDTGIGISQDKLRLIFEAFQQADGSTSRRYGGTGLGLSISRELAQLLGGQIHVESTPGRGSTFTLLLPERFTGPHRTELDGLGLPSAESEASVEEPTAAVAAPEDPGADQATEVEVDLPDALEPTGEAGALTEMTGNGHVDVRGDAPVVLVVGDRPATVDAVREAGGESGMQVLTATRPAAALALIHEVTPDAVVIDRSDGGPDGLALLGQVKRQLSTRHIPVHVIAPEDEQLRALKLGAHGVSEPPLTADRAGEIIRELGEMSRRTVHRLLLVEDDQTDRDSLDELLGSGPGIEVVAVASGEEALEALSSTPVDCMVLDLKLPGTSGQEVLAAARRDPRLARLPIIVHTGVDLDDATERELRVAADSVVVKTAGSPERLLDEVTMYLHRAARDLPLAQRRMIEQLRSADEVLEGKHVLIVDDDLRNVFAVASALEGHGLTVSTAETGQEALERLGEDPSVELVLMDIMMPGMDGNEATRALRRDPRFVDLPIIALTAKAMEEDREESLAAGASDYVTKPVDIEHLISLLRVWLYR